MWTSKTTSFRNARAQLVERLGVGKVVLRGRRMSPFATSGDRRPSLLPIRIQTCFRQTRPAAGGQGSRRELHNFILPITLKLFCANKKGLPVFGRFKTAVS